jgi:glycosyltransferase involved in cell wall biosynthesis
MKILYLCTYYHTAMIFRDAMDRLKKFGHEVKAFNAVAKNTVISGKYQHIMDESVIHKECFNRWDRYFYYIKQNKIYKSLMSSLNIKEYDIIHSHSLFNGGYVAYKIKKRYGIPYVVSVRNTDIYVFLKIPFLTNLANKIIENAAGVQFLSESYQKMFIGKYVKPKLIGAVKEKSIVAGNGLEQFWLDNKGIAKKLNSNRNLSMLSVGIINRNKNYQTTMGAIEELAKKGYQIKWTVVGQVKDINILRQLQKRKFVQVIDYLPKIKLIDVYRKNDIYVMPSIHETFGRVYAEAMTQGLPVVYSKGQGFDGFFADGRIGHAVPCKDKKYIVQSILKIVGDYSNISSRCVDLCDIFDWDQISKRLSEFYYQSIARDHGGQK